MLRKILSITAIATMAVMLSCQQQEVAKNDLQIPSNITAQLQKAGFDLSEGFVKKDGGYLVEYDIFLTEAQINELASSDELNIGEEHYRTRNLVSGNPRTIDCWMDPAFGQFMQNSFDAALARYNALNLKLRFRRVSTRSSSDIAIQAFFERPSGGFVTLGFSAGFPSGGDPASPISLNTYVYNSTSQRADATTVIAHEIGHAIGFRHTDYANRSFSCGSGGNEGSGGVGAVYISGTPRGGSSGSWMLACSGGGDRPFTSSDRTALTTVY
jgi:Dual-action HEIGH metallo-peptidase